MFRPSWYTVGTCFFKGCRWAAVWSLVLITSRGYPNKTAVNPDPKPATVSTADLSFLWWETMGALEGAWEFAMPQMTLSWDRGKEGLRIILVLPVVYGIPHKQERVSKERGSTAGEPGVNIFSFVVKTDFHSMRNPSGQEVVTSMKLTIFIFDETPLILLWMPQTFIAEPYKVPLDIHTHSGVISKTQTALFVKELLRECRCAGGRWSELWREEFLWKINK